jgi:hypothetical protein
VHACLVELFDDRVAILNGAFRAFAVVLTNYAVRLRVCAIRVRVSAVVVRVFAVAVKVFAVVVRDYSFQSGRNGGEY